MSYIDYKQKYLKYKKKYLELVGGVNRADRRLYGLTPYEVNTRLFSRNGENKFYEMKQNLRTMDIKPVPFTDIEIGIPGEHDRIQGFHWKTDPSSRYFDFDQPWIEEGENFFREFSNLCNVANEQKNDCGRVGTDKAQCEDDGCCWDPNSHGSHVPWCYKKHKKQIHIRIGWNFMKYMRNQGRGLVGITPKNNNKDNNIKYDNKKRKAIVLLFLQYLNFNNFSDVSRLGTFPEIDLGSLHETKFSNPNRTSDERDGYNHIYSTWTVDVGTTKPQIRQRQEKELRRSRKDELAEYLFNIKPQPSPYFGREIERESFRDNTKPITDDVLEEDKYFGVKRPFAITPYIDQFKIEKGYRPFG